MLAWWIAAAGWAEPPHPCALDHLPEGAISWTPAGLVTLWKGSVRLRDIEVGSPIPVASRVTCEGTTVEIFNQTARATLAFQQVELDLAELLSTLAPPDGVAVEVARVSEALSAGDPAGAVARLSSLDAADPRVAETWEQVLASVPGEPAAALAALDGLATVPPPPAFAARIALARGGALLALGRAREAADAGTRAVEAGAAPEGALLRADARWALGEKAGARLDYAAAAAGLPRERWSTTLVARCRACR